MNEEWRPVVGYEGLYEVSNLGRVRSLIGQWGSRKKNIKPQEDCRGYYQIRLRKTAAIRPVKFIHRLVYEAFNGRISEGMQVDHIDGNPKNNEVRNLRELTNHENQMAYKKVKDGKRGESKFRGVYFHKRSKNWQVSIGCRGKSYYVGMFPSQEEAALAYNKKALELGFLPEALNKVPGYGEEAVA